MDERYFEDDATMRLVERDRKALGMEPPATKWRSASLSELAYGYHEDVVPERTGATVVAHLTAHPSEGLIAGAVVTVACAIVNDGVAPARDVRIVLPLPEGTRYVPGSGKRDGTPEADAEPLALLGEGRNLGTLAPSQRTTLVVLLAIEPGLAPVLVSATITAKTGAVVGARSLHLSRSSAPNAFVAALSAADAQPVLPETPFYELDPEEELVYEAADAAMSPIVAPAPAPEPEPEPEPERPRPGSAFADIVAAAEAVLPDIEPPPEIALAPVVVAPRGAPRTFNVDLHGGALFTVRLPQARLTFLAQLFSGPKMLGMIGHYVLLNALAAVQPVPDAGDDSLARFATAQEQRLSRALIAKRLGKTLLAEDVAAPLPAQFPPRLQMSESVDLPSARDAGAIVLYRIMRPNELSFLSASVNNTNAAPFMRASQLFVGMCGHNAIVDGEERRAEIANALRAYSAACASEINRLFVRARLAKKIDLFDAAPPELDRQAGALIELLERPA